MLQLAQGGVILSYMGDIKRGQDANARQNLLYVIEACSRRLKRAKGGQAYLARLIGSRPSYISAVLYGQDGRNLGRDLKTKIERAFNLPPDWMDDAHDESVVVELSQKVPSLPHPRSTGTHAPDPPGYVRELKSTVDELRERLAALESQLASRRNIRK